MTPAGFAVVRSGDYSLSSAEMAIALSAIPPRRRSNAWLLLLGAPVASAAVREAIRGGPNTPFTSNWLTLIGPVAVGAVGALGLFATRYAATRERPRYRY
jgi:hypothetical protein